MLLVHIASRIILLSWLPEMGEITAQELIAYTAISSYVCTQDNCKVHTL